MKIAVFGGTSQIAKDLIIAISKYSDHTLHLYSRRPAVVTEWLECQNLSTNYQTLKYSDFNVGYHYEAIINFVGVGDPAQAATMGASIFDVTLTYDEMALNYLKAHPHCRYIFLSSGAAYGSGFESPADENTHSIININNLKPQDWYAVAKLHAECRHRSLQDLPIIDIRVFNYFSHTQDMSARFLMTDIVRAIRDETILKTSSDHIVRDFIHPADFYNLVIALLSSPPANTVVDCYSRDPIDKTTLLKAMEDNFGLKYEVTQSGSGVNATGLKPHYYSLNKKAEQFAYQPSMTSLQGLLLEVKKYLSDNTSCKTS